MYCVAGFLPTFRQCGSVTWERWLPALSECISGLDTILRSSVITLWELSRETPVKQFSKTLWRFRGSGWRKSQDVRFSWCVSHEVMWHSSKHSLISCSLVLPVQETRSVPPFWCSPYCNSWHHHHKEMTNVWVQFMQWRNGSLLGAHDVLCIRAVILLWYDKHHCPFHGTALFALSLAFGGAFIDCFLCGMHESQVCNMLVKLVYSWKHLNLLGIARCSKWIWLTSSTTVLCENSLCVCQWMWFYMF